MMDKKLIKLYLIIVISSIFISFIIPSLMPKVSKALTPIYTNIEVTIHESIKPEATKEIKTGAKAIFIMDDGWDTQFTQGYSILKEYNMKGNISVIPSRVGEDNYVNIDMLTELYINGWDLLNHTYNHIELTDLSKKQQKDEVDKCRNWLVNHNFKRGKDIVIFPKAYYTGDVFNILKEKNYKSARSLDTVWILGNTIEVAKNTQVHNLVTDTEVSWAMDWIDKAIQSNGTIIFINHKFDHSEDNTGMYFDPKKFKEIVKYLDKNKEKITVISYSEWLNKE